jgi:1-acyl-sn-glycerol-3-phosphate acyltransferase
MQSQTQSSAPTPQSPKPSEKSKSLDGQESPFVYSVMRVVAGILLPLFARLHTVDVENVPKEGPVILAINHIHWLDIPLASFRIPRVTHYMAKIELFSIPIIGWLIRRLGAFPVRRGESDRESLRTSERMLADGNLLMIFPEGHRSGNGKLLKGHPGASYLALRTGVPVVAVGISGTENVFKRFNYGPWAPKVTIRFSKPFTLGTGGKRSREGMAEATDTLMRQIAAMLPPEYRGAYAGTTPDVPTSTDTTPAGVATDTTTASSKE